MLLHTVLFLIKELAMLYASNGVQLQTIHSVEVLLQKSLHAESLTTKIHHVKISALLASYSVERSARNERAQLENVTL